MNKLMVMAAARWAANNLVAVLLAHNLISPADVSGWTNTFINFFLAIISISLLIWTLMQNRWPALVKFVAGLKQVKSVTVNRGDYVDQPALVAHPDVNGQ